MKILSLLFILLVSTNVLAEDKFVYEVGEAKLLASQLAILTPKYAVTPSKSQKDGISNFFIYLAKDLDYYKKYISHKLVPIESTSSANRPDMSQFEMPYAMNIYVDNRNKGNSTIDIAIYNTSNAVKLVEKSIVMKSKGPAVESVHSLSDEIVRSMASLDRTIFTSKIVYVSDELSVGSKQIKELFIMDFDGRNKRQLTFHGGTVISPAVSPDARKIIYSLITDENTRRRNVNLYMYDMASGRSKKISSRRGLNSGAVFSSDGKSIFMTLSHTGNAEIMKMNLKTKRLTPVTKNKATDVDPDITPDGELMTFLSTRHGSPMIYVGNPNGVEKNVKRVSFIGKFNATPRFSPDGQSIVFSSWLDKKFDLFKVKSSGRGLVRLTKDFGSNESPSFSSDGNFILFSSQRVLSRSKAVSNLYIIDTDGTIMGQITKDSGNCISPRWVK